MNDRMEAAPDTGRDPGAEANSTKAALRRHMRSVRRAIDDPAARSERIWGRITTLEEVRAARRLLAFASIPGEPDTAPFIAWAAEDDRDVAVPEDRVDPTWANVVIVPGLAFTRAGDRLGQGGGWYDRFLADVRGDCRVIGVAFHEQLVDEVPTEAHDVRMHYVVTDRETVLVP